MAAATQPPLPLITPAQHKPNPKPLPRTGFWGSISPAVLQQQEHLCKLFIAGVTTAVTPGVTSDTMGADVVTSGSAGVREPGATRVAAAADGGGGGMVRRRGGGAAGGGGVLGSGRTAGAARAEGTAAAAALARVGCASERSQLAGHKGAGLEVCEEYDEDGLR